MLAIGRALMTNPRLLVLDEATEGLAPVIRREIWSAIGELKRDGRWLLIVDKSLSELLPLADSCVIIERGQSVWHGEPSALTRQSRSAFLASDPENHPDLNKPERSAPSCVQKYPGG